MKINMKNVCAAIPVGGVVYEDYLVETLQLLRKSDVRIYIGIDSQPSLISLNNYESVYKICKEYAHKVIEFPPESYFRPGSIWKKMYMCWKDSGAEYVRGIGYDDLLPPELLSKQYEFMQANPHLQATYSDYQVLDEVQKQDNYYQTYMNGFKKIRKIGKNPFSFICWLVKFSAIDNPDFQNRLEIASGGFEYFFHTYLFNLNHSHIATKKRESPIRREHQRTISHMSKDVILEKEILVKKIREMTGYSAEQTIDDWKKLNLQKFVHDVRRKYSPLYAWIAKLEDAIRGVPY